MLRSLCLTLAAMTVAWAHERNLDDKLVAVADQEIRQLIASARGAPAPICALAVNSVGNGWGRWADAVGNVGPFSATVVSRVEGVSSAMLFHAASGRAPSPILEAPVAREPVYSVAVRDGQFEYPSPPRIAPSRHAASAKREPGEWGPNGLCPLGRGE